MTRTILQRLDSWRFWMALAWIALCGIVLWGIFLTQRSIKLSASDTQQRTFAQARIDADYRNCLRSIPSLRSLSTHVEGVNELAWILVANNRALLHVPPVAVRRENLRRLVEAARKIAAVRSFPVPTRATCYARRRVLGG